MTKLSKLSILLIFVQIITCLNFPQTFANTNGNLVISSETQKYENVHLFINGSLIIEGNASVEFLNSVIVIIQSYEGQFNITLKETSTLKIINSTVTSNYSFNIYGTDESTICIDNSDVRRGKAILKDHAKISINNSRIKGIESNTTQKIWINNSEMEEITNINSEIAANESKIAILKTYGSSLTVLSNFSQVSQVIMNDSSSLTLDNCFGYVDSVELYGHSKLIVYKSKIVRLTARDNSTITFDNSKLKSVPGKPAADFRTLDYVEAMIVNGSALEELTARMSSKVYIKQSSVTELNIRGKATIRAEDCTEVNSLIVINVNDEANVSIARSDIKKMTVEGAAEVKLEEVKCTGVGNHILSKSGNPKIEIENSRIDLIYAAERAEIEISNSMLKDIISENSTKIQISNSTIHGKINIYESCEMEISLSKVDGVLSATGASILIARNSNLTLVENYEKSSSYINNCIIDGYEATDNALIVVRESTLGSLKLKARGVSSSLIGLKRGFINYWNFLQNGSIEIIERIGYAPNVTLYQTEIGGFDLTFSGKSKVLIQDCLLNHLGILGGTELNLTSSELLDIHISGTSKVIWKEPKIRVTDQNNNPISGVNVTIMNENGTVIASGVTDANGTVYFDGPLEIVAKNAPFLKIELSYNGKVSYTDIFEGLSGHIVLSRERWQFWQLLIALIAAVLVTIIGIIVYKRRRKAKHLK